MPSCSGVSTLRETISPFRSKNVTSKDGMRTACSARLCRSAANSSTCSVSVRVSELPSSARLAIARGASIRQSACSQSHCQAGRVAGQRAASASRCGQATWPTAATTSSSSVTLSTARTHGLRQRAPLRASRRKRGSLVLSTSATSVPGVSPPLPVFFFLGGQSPASSGSIDASVGGPARASSAAASDGRLGVVEPPMPGPGSRTIARPGGESGAGAAKSSARSAAVRVGSSAGGVSACTGSDGGSTTGRRASSDGGMYIDGGSGSGVGAAISGMATAGSGAGSGGTAGSGAVTGAGGAAGCHPGALGRPSAPPKSAGACGAAGGGKAEGIVPGVTDCARAASSASRAAKRGAMVPRVATGEKEVGAGAGCDAWGGGAKGAGGGGKGRVAGVKPV